MGGRGPDRGLYPDRRGAIDRRRNDRPQLADARHAPLRRRGGPAVDPRTPRREGHQGRRGPAPPARHRRRRRAHRAQGRHGRPRRRRCRDPGRALRRARGRRLLRGRAEGHPPPATARPGTADLPRCAPRQAADVRPPGGVGARRSGAVARGGAGAPLPPLPRRARTGHAGGPRLVVRTDDHRRPERDRVGRGSARPDGDRRGGRLALGLGGRRGGGQAPAAGAPRPLRRVPARLPRPVRDARSGEAGPRQPRSQCPSARRSLRRRPSGLSAPRAGGRAARGPAPASAPRSTGRARLPAGGRPGARPGRPSAPRVGPRSAPGTRSRRRRRRA